jgi:hypothetical protein
MEEKKLIIEAIFDEKGMALKIGTDGEFTAIEMLGVLEMAKIEVLKDNGNIADK